MKIQFISHAGFITEAAGKKIFTDPWTKGKAFNEGWALLSPPATVNYGEIDYIFVTHEHPDHFSLPTLKSIDPEQRSRITILYQQHASLRLKDAFEKLGFKEVKELPLYKWSHTDGIDFYCGSCGSMDSFLAIRYNDKTLLNINDCVLNEKQYRYIKKEIGEIDILFTQFSFANWVGNDKDEYDECTKKIKGIYKQIEIFKPSYTVPFASFVYFCNAENSRQNAWMNTPRKIYDLHIPTIQFMYTGEKVDMDHPEFNSQQAVDKYMNDLGQIIIDPTPASIPFEEVCKVVEEGLDSFYHKLLRPLRMMVKPFGIYMHDIDKALWIDPAKKQYTTCSKEQCKYEMCSQMCWYMFKYSWGTGSLLVSGMYLDHKLNEPASKYFFFQNMLSTEFMSFKSISQLRRTSYFLWRKKWEIFYKLV